VRSKQILGLLIPLACAALFVRLGFWQISRHLQRAEYNARVSARLVTDPVLFTSLPPDTGLVRGQRVTLSGRFLYDRQQVLAGRVSEGRPSVHLITPVEREGNDTLDPVADEGNDTLVAVVRGWVWSADAAGVDRSRFREADSVSLRGYAVPLPLEGLPAPTDASRPLRSLNVAALAARFARPVSPYMVVMTSDSAYRADSVPHRLGPPVLAAGSHKSYAIQWFAFAVIAVVGGVLLFRRKL